MKLVGWLLRGALVLYGLLVVVNVFVFAYQTIAHGTPVNSLAASAFIWDVWIVSWIVTARWSRPATAQPAALDQALHWTPTLIGVCLMSFGSAIPTGLKALDTPLWRISTETGWMLTAACAAGLLFTWWARISLGSLWSASVSRTDGHTVVRRGPYRLVRHPIYSGVILAALAYAVQIDMAANLTGALLVTFGFWLKALLEERFLSRELGDEAYADYRRRTPMLIPFLPARG